MRELILIVVSLFSEPREPWECPAPAQRGSICKVDCGDASTRAAGLCEGEDKE